MAFITAPDFHIRAINWSLSRPAQINTSAWTGRRTVVATPWHGKWRAEVELAPLVGADSARILRSFLARCRGSVNTFRIAATEGPQNENGGVTTKGIVPAGETSMTLTGVETRLSDGQMVTIDGQLLVVAEGGALVGSDQLILFEPPLRKQAAAGMTVVTREPYALVHLVDSTAGWSVEPGTIYGIAFAVEEAILEPDGAAPETLPAAYTGYLMGDDFDNSKYVQMDTA